MRPLYGLCYTAYAAARVYQVGELPIKFMICKVRAFSKKNHTEEYYYSCTVDVSNSKAIVCTIPERSLQLLRSHGIVAEKGITPFPSHLLLELSSLSVPPPPPPFLLIWSQQQVTSSSSLGPPNARRAAASSTCLFSRSEEGENRTADKSLRWWNMMRPFGCELECGRTALFDLRAEVGNGFIANKGFGRMRRNVFQCKLNKAHVELGLGKDSIILQFGSYFSSKSECISSSVEGRLRIINDLTALTSRTGITQATLVCKYRIKIVFDAL